MPFTIATFVVVTLLAQPSKAPQVFAAVPEIQRFDPSWQKLPKTFKGDNIASITKALDTEKGDYESTSQFKARLAKLAPDGRVYTFLCDSDPFKTEYNADDQEFTFARVSYESYIRVLEVKKHGKSYYGTNAFGVSAKISEVLKTNYAILDQGWDRDSGVFAQLSVPSGEAKSFKKDVGFALIVTLVPRLDFEPNNVLMGTPYLVVNHYQSTATVTDPMDYNSTTYALVVDVQKIVLFRKSDRSILLIASPKTSTKVFENRDAEAPSRPDGSAVSSEAPAHKVATDSPAPIFKEPRPAEKAWDVVASRAYTKGCISGLAVKYGAARTPDQIRYACECVTWHLEDRFSWGEMTESIQSGGVKVLETSQSASAECKKNRPPELGPDPG